MSQGLKKNRSIEQLGLGWNMLGDAGATSMAECMATTISIQNLENNHIKSVNTFHQEIMNNIFVFPDTYIFVF